MNPEAAADSKGMSPGREESEMWGKNAVSSWLKEGNGPVIN